MLPINKYKALKAFTILELVIGLVISSIVISMVYVIYENISKQMIEYSLQQEELMEYNQFQSILFKDIKLAKELVIIDQKHIRLDMQSKQIDYFFYRDNIVRKSNAKETFNLKVLGVEFNNREKVLEEQQTIKLKTSLLGQEIIVFEEKPISRAKQINNYFLSEY